jgi:hypothetical protein
MYYIILIVALSLSFCELVISLSSGRARRAGYSLEETSSSDE